MGGAYDPKEEAAFIAEKQKNKIENYEKPLKYKMHSFLPEDEKTRVGMMASSDVMHWDPINKKMFETPIYLTPREKIENRLLESAKKILNISNNPNYSRDASAPAAQENNKLNLSKDDKEEDEFNKTMKKVEQYWLNQQFKSRFATEEELNKRFEEGKK